MKRRTFLLLLVAGWIAGGCESMRVRSTYDEKVSFKELHTFCWVAPPSWLHNDPRLRMDLVEPLVQREVETLLKQRGFQPGDCATADFQVTFTGGLDENFARARRPGVPGGPSVTYVYSPGGGSGWFTSYSGTTMAEERRPALAIEIRQPQTDRVWWQGVASASLPKAVDDAQVTKRVQTAVEEILKQFPPAAPR